MECCRLCLQNVEVNILDCTETLRILRNFLPRTNRCFTQPPALCQTCMDNARSVRILTKSVDETATKIKIAMIESSLDEIDLRSLNKKGKRIPGNIHLCRICLNTIGEPKVFLYESSVNVLPHAIIRSMLQFCNIVPNLSVSGKPVMCFDCWQLLQACYSFKKDCLDTDRKIKMYCELFKVRSTAVDSDELKRIHLYFSQDIPPNIPPNTPHNSEDSYMIDKEQIKNEVSPSSNEFKTSKRIRNKFTTDDDRTLIKSYFEITKNEEDFFGGYWNEIHKRWNLLKPNKYLNVASVRRRVYAILNQAHKNSLSKKEIKKIRYTVKQELKRDASTPNSPMENVKQPLITTRDKSVFIRIRPEDRISISKHCDMLSSKNQVEEFKFNTSNELEDENCLEDVDSNSDDSFIDEGFNRIVPEGESIENHESDSDDSFIDEAIPSRFTPHIKLEPLSDDDEEIIIIEPNILERNVNNCELNKPDDESIPNLERMETPTKQLKIQNFYSVDVERQGLNMITVDDVHPNLEIEDLKTCRRISDRDQKDKGLYKCIQCSFETKAKRSAYRHSRWHENPEGNMLYECQHCSYRISNKKKFKKHMTCHKTNEAATSLDINSKPPNLIDRNDDQSEDKPENESPPQLQRMDIPPLQGFHNGENNLNLEAEDLINYRRIHANENDPKQDNDSPPCLQRMDIFIADGKNEHLNKLKTSRRISDRNQDGDWFKCKQCSFETKSHIAAAVHSKWHPRRKKVYSCRHCSYKILNKRTLQQHILYSHKLQNNSDEKTLDTSKTNVKELNPDAITNDSLPVLRGIDMPTKKINIQNIYNVDVKRETLNMFDFDRK